ncbi:hypothetical protein E1263_11090 [Kribbella antibiotica]|uniref:Uncharacterized protein n=1 Tax=Kribbella antibiotica TaxID=190195 RepID=A0A4R4ZP74_9ACTN|nr:hypothetical protein [Kribbella antibiotica]TDD60465.1 hypothetical protein E1263_11090 [Kribbella antibiotica]
MGEMLEAWAGVLDRSWAEIAALSADARNFDRLRVNRIADVWDNNTFPFVGAACARGAGRRENLALQGVRWMADFGATRHAWVLEQAVAAGHPIELPPPMKHPNGPVRDGEGTATPGTMDLTAETIEELAADYAFDTAEVRTLCVQRSEGVLVGEVTIAASRRYQADGGDLAELRIQFEGVDQLRFEQSDRCGVSFDCQAGTTLLRLGDRGVVQGASGTVSNRDVRWSRSKAGRTADAVLPPLQRAKVWEPERGLLEGTACEAAELLRWAMIMVRSSWALSLIHTTPVHEYALAFAGAGTDILAAGRSFRREAAFRRLVNRWRSAGGELLLPLFDQTLKTDPALPDADDPPEPDSQLMVADYTTPSFFDRTNASTFVFASPGTPWGRRRIRVENPQQFAVRVEAFGTTLCAAQQGGLLAVS